MASKLKFTSSLATCRGEVAAMATQCNGKELLLQVQQCGLCSSMVRDSLCNGVDSIDRIPLVVMAQTAMEEETELPPLDLELFFWLFTHSVQPEH